jgi:uncharacterized protein YprB with RNaseH-like and TPR domain
MGAPGGAPALAPSDPDERLATISSLRARLDALERRPLERPAARPSLRDREASISSALPSAEALARALARGALGDGEAFAPSALAPSVGRTARVPLRGSDALASGERALPGEQHATPHGPLSRLVTAYDADHHHGSARVALAREVPASEVAILALDPALASVDFSRALYIDTETTGLAGGSGTLPFLIGMAWFEGERLVVEQLFLPRPGLELPLLARLAERMAEASAIVSYNGKSFDWPLLRTRFILNRIAAPKLPAHLDLLHCARRVYKARLGSVRLLYMEQELLGMERVGDIPGELIPQTYFAFLRGAAASTLTSILDHNRSDVVALPALLGELLRRFRGEHAREDARDKLGFARVAARAAASERALACANAVVEVDGQGELAASALFLVGELKLRSGEFEQARLSFERALEGCVRPLELARVHLALAKLHERKTRCYEQALHHASYTAACEGELASGRRVARLRARIDKLARAARAALGARTRERASMRTPRAPVQEPS